MECRSRVHTCHAQVKCGSHLASVPVVWWAVEVNLSGSERAFYKGYNDCQFLVQYGCSSI